ncbi:MAG: hypothetical protein B6U89_05410 [Desulfurococcales archaeon ex4484_58]|nr:MAG: hypothetical protein B6U89_05410 [Desulfurococcales archaeon ex4484_58]
MIYYINKSSLATIGLVVGFIYDLLSSLAIIQFNYIIDSIFDIIEYLSFIGIMYVYRIFRIDQLIETIRLISRSNLPVYLNISLPILLIIIVNYAIGPEKIGLGIMLIYYFLLVFLVMYDIIYILSFTIIKPQKEGSTSTLIENIATLPYPGIKKIYYCYDKLAHSGRESKELYKLLATIVFKHLSTILFGALFFVSIVMIIFDIIFVPIVLLSILLYRSSRGRIDLDIDIIERMFNEKYDLIHGFKIMYILSIGLLLLIPMGLFIVMILLNILIKYGLLYIVSRINALLFIVSFTLTFLLQLLSVYSIYMFLKKKIVINPIAINIGSMCVFVLLIILLKYSFTKLLFFPIILSIIAVLLSIKFRNHVYNEVKVIISYVLNGIVIQSTFNLLSDNLSLFLIIGFIFLIVLYIVLWHHEKLKKIPFISIDYKKYIGRVTYCKEYIKIQLIRYELVAIIIYLLFFVLLLLGTPLDVYSTLILIVPLILCLELIIASLLNDSYKICRLGGYNYYECFG